jgi:hypothetical protein
MIRPPEQLKWRGPGSDFIAQEFRQLSGRSDGIVRERGDRMKRRSRDEEREQRITMEIVVDAYTPEEQAMGWYYSLEDRLTFPFVASCTAERAVSPLRVGDEVEVVGMAPDEECQHEMFVLIGWERRGLAVPWASWRASRWMSRPAR